MNERKKPGRETPFGDPELWPIGSPESRAAARALANARMFGNKIVLIHSVPRPEGQSTNHKQMPDGRYVLEITCA